MLSVCPNCGNEDLNAYNEVEGTYVEYCKRCDFEVRTEPEDSA